MDRIGFIGEIYWEIKAMEKEFFVADKLVLPEHLFVKKIQNMYLILSTEHPNWIVVDECQYNLFNFLLDRNIIDSLVLYSKKYGTNEDKTLTIAQELLEKIEKYQFYANTAISEQECIENISKTIHINLLNDCNLRCSHCFLPAGLLPLSCLPVDTLIDFLKKLFNEVKNPNEIVLSGGEPMLYRGLPKLLRFIKESENNVTLFTNGLLINKNNITLLKQYVDNIQISMEGFSREKYELIRGKNTYDTLLKTFDLVKEYDIPIVLAITALDEVFDDIEEHLVPFLQRLNFDNITIRINDEVDNKGSALHLNQSNFQQNHDKKIQMRNLLQRLEEFGYYTENTKGRNIHFSNCGIGANIVVNYDGSIYPCFFFEKPFFTLADSPEKIVTYFNNLNKSTGIDKIEGCKSCELKWICNGGCRLQNYLKHGDYTNIFCTEEIKEQKILALFTEALG
jgi:radical SAM protein with 4Fe4S-binding SPASM domain